MPDGDLISARDVPCCPQLKKDPCCERLEFTYKLVNRLGDIPVEIGYVFEFERCPGPMSLGDIVYSTTLLPGEKVRLYSSNRASRFTYDSSSEVSYRHENSSDETYFMAAMDRYMHDLTVTDRTSANSSASGSASSSASAAGGGFLFFGGGTAKVSGNYSAQSSADFAREIRRHAEGSSQRAAAAVRSVNSVSIGEVQTRNHAEGESESAYEASTRVFRNENRCHAVNYFAYQLVKEQTIRLRLKAVTRRVVDAAGDAGVVARPVLQPSEVSVIPTGVLATKSDRVAVQTVGRTSAFADQEHMIDAAILPKTGGNPVDDRDGVIRRDASKPIGDAPRERAIRAVDTDLVKAGVLDNVGGSVSRGIAAELSFEITLCLPTQGILVKGCIDDCSVCEPMLEKKIELELAKLDLENKLLARRIELLDQSQEYRCCPVGEAEEPAGGGDGPSGPGG